MSDLISRQAAINKIESLKRERVNPLTVKEKAMSYILEVAASCLYYLPSAKPDRDIPKKPIATTDRAWGIPHRQAVCPKCDYYLGHVAFLGDYKGKRITYCETCGQAIDWEGWDFDE